MPKAPTSIINALNLVHEGLFAVWNSTLERFQIFYQDKRNGLTRIIMTVEEEDGSYRPLDMRTVNYLTTHVAWDTLDKFPSPQDLWAHLNSKEETKKLKREAYRTEYRKWWNREHRKEWRAALENAKRGIFSSPEERERKIII